LDRGSARQKAAQRSHTQACTHLYKTESYVHAPSRIRTHSASVRAA